MTEIMKELGKKCEIITFKALFTVLQGLKQNY